VDGHPDLATPLLLGWLVFRAADAVVATEGHMVEAIRDQWLMALGIGALIVALAVIWRLPRR